ncbi:MAG: hypothetical protein ABIJ46_01600 [bacterium]
MGKNFWRTLSASSVALCLLLALPVAAAAAVRPGDLVKLPDDRNPDTQHDTAVYYVGSGGFRYVFPNLNTYRTWYDGFGSVREISSGEMAALRIGGTVAYRSGTRLVKVQTDPQVYAVEPGGWLRSIGSEATAIELYGPNWSSRVDDLPDAFFSGYRVGPGLSAPVYPDGSVLRRTADGALFLIDGGVRRRIAAGEVRSGLRLQERFFVDVGSSTLDAYPSGEDLGTVEPSLVDVSGVDAETRPRLSVGEPSGTALPIGGDGTWLALDLSTRSDVTLKSVEVRLEALTDGPHGKDSETDDDAGGLVYGSGVRPNVTSIRLVDESGGEPLGRVGLSSDPAADQRQTLRFSGSWRVTAGSVGRLRLVGRLDGLVPAGQSYRATVIAASAVLQDDSGQPVEMSSSSELVGPSLSATEDSFRVEASTGCCNETAVRGASSIPVSGFSLLASAASRNIVTSVVLQGYVDEGEDGSGYLPGSDADNGTATAVRDMVSAVYLYGIGGERLAGPVSVDLTGRVRFDGLQIELPAGGQLTVVVRVDLMPSVDLEQNPNRLSFDLPTVAGSLVVVDGDGVPVRTEGEAPNGGIEPSSGLTVISVGPVEFDWSGSSGPAIAGTEALIGTLSLDPEHDGYGLRSFGLRQVGPDAVSLGSVRLEYDAAGGGTVSVPGRSLGGAVVWSGLSIPVPVDVSTDVRVLARIVPRAGGAVYGEELSLEFDRTGPLSFVSSTNGREYGSGDLGSADFPLVRNRASDLTVRFSQLTAGRSGGSPSGDVYRSSGTEVLRFWLRAGDSGGVRVRQMAFRLKPSDAGIAGADNDALERWSDINGDVFEDDGIADLRRIIEGSNVGQLLAEGADGSIRYSLVSGGVEDATPAGRDSAGGDYALLRYDFGSGTGFTVSAGSTVEFSLELDTSALSGAGNYPLEVTLMSGSDFVWTDIPSGAYDPRYGGDVLGLPVTSPRLTVRQ